MQVNTMQSAGLSNVQYEVLKLYGIGLAESELQKLKRQLAYYCDSSG